MVYPDSVAAIIGNKEDVNKYNEGEEDISRDNEESLERAESWELSAEIINLLIIKVRTKRGEVLCSSVQYSTGRVGPS